MQCTLLSTPPPPSLPPPPLPFATIFNIARQMEKFHRHWVQIRWSAHWRIRCAGCCHWIFLNWMTGKTIKYVLLKFKIDGDVHSKSPFDWQIAAGGGRLSRTWSFLLALFFRLANLFHSISPIERKVIGICVHLQCNHSHSHSHSLRPCQFWRRGWRNCQREWNTKGGKISMHS